ncbi:hypothetical protein [Amycolatopsis australiensis]|uniref:Uncharacterized protein n=1 Tax=Amycolatopsis australiensis TaxID=546364 RepID=A0A1K1SLM6_9PSEU|nr:hypothetical protein [Amycolatopsis australiensis]SFW85190.1 hypothetical protein SAMN04489730_6066 [Amycolatopsis australiensis]
MTVRSANDGFAELVLADPAWVRAEFDAIVAANFEPPLRPSPVPRTPDAPHPAAGRDPAPWRVLTLPVRCPRRERSPPEPRFVTGGERGKR